jgi:Domain of unknown function DUF488
MESPDWEARYKTLLDRAGDLLVDRLAGVPQPFCLLCAEKRITECHRRLIAEYLVGEKGAGVEPIERRTPMECTCFSPDYTPGFGDSNYQTNEPWQLYSPAKAISSYLKVYPRPSRQALIARK